MIKIIIIVGVALVALFDFAAIVVTREEDDNE